MGAQDACAIPELKEIAKATRKPTSGKQAGLLVDAQSLVIPAVTQHLGEDIALPPKALEHGRQLGFQGEGTLVLYAFADNDKLALPVSPDDRIRDLGDQALAGAQPSVQ